MAHRAIWMAAAGVALVQAAFYLATLGWPPGSGAEALALRLMLWQALPLVALQGFVGIPAGVALIWRARSGPGRGLLVFSLLAGVALPALGLWETLGLQQLLADPQTPSRQLRLLGLARWADAGLALGALVALRLAFRAEQERAEQEAG